ncbi:hypothetical protein ABT369_26395 [Dactylosporangium sp. NPDC000244]|uniref:hypothetical protein n=1 Tax=Dactylosporangium sp. NPDC000244 TaxID=3154365 RepID=UPI003325C01E
MPLNRPLPPPRPQALPGIPEGSRVVTVPFARRFAALLATDTVQRAKHEHGLHLVFAVCGACEPCRVYSGTVSAIAQLNEIEPTLFQPAAPSRDDRDGHRGSRDWSPGVSAAVQLVDGGYADAVRASKRRAAQTEAVDGNVPGPWGNHCLYALAAFLVDVFSGLVEPPPVLWMPYDAGTCVAADAALRLLGWPTDLVAVVASDDRAPSWPVSALAPYLGPRAAENRIEAVTPHHAAAAQQLLARAGTTGGSPHDAHGVAGLLADRGADRDLVLVPQVSAGGSTGTGTR